MRQEHWWDNLLWILIFLFIVPSSLVVASWGSLPGSRLYTVKLLAEDAMIAMTLSKGAKSELQVAYADKRLSDATQLLSQNESGDGLEYFRKQMEDAKVALAQAPDGSEKEELKAKYLAALQNASHQLEQQKQIISTAHNLPAPVSAVKRQKNGNPKEVVVVKEVIKYNEITKVNEVTRVNVVTHVNEVTNVTNVTNVINQIDQTQNQISDIIQQVQQQSPPQQILPTVQPTVQLPAETSIPNTPTPILGSPQQPSQDAAAQHNNSGNGNNNGGQNGSNGNDHPNSNDD